MSNLFHYKGRDIHGEVVTETLEASSISDVIAYLKKRDIIPINIKPTKQYRFNLRNILLFNNNLRKIEPYHIMNFCRQLAVLNNAGLSIIKALNKLSLSASSPHLSTILAKVAGDVSAGITLSEALEKHPKVFSPIIVSIVDVGENTGHLSESLLYLSNFIETSIANHRRLLSTVRYPIFVLITLMAAMLIMNFLVIPKFTDIFSKFHLDLPLATRIIISSSNFMVNNKIILFISSIITFWGGNCLLKTRKIRCIWDKYKLRLPIFGDLQKRIILSQFTWTFSLILRSGIPIIKGINLASNTTENAYFSVQLLKMSSAIEHGENLSQAAIASGLFTPMTIQMIEVGEESEKLDDALLEIAKYYDAEIDYDLKRLNESIEPILLTIIGAMVLVLALGIYFPMWDLIKITDFR